MRGDVIDFRKAVLFPVPSPPKVESSFRYGSALWAVEAAVGLVWLLQALKRNVSRFALYAPPAYIANIFTSCFHMIHVVMEKE